MIKVNKRKGISLISLVITIILMIILAAAIILSLTEANIIGNANEGTFKSDIKAMKDELSLYIAEKVAETDGKYDETKLYADKNSLEENGAEVDGKTIKDVITSIENKYLEEIVIDAGKVKYIGDEINKIQWSDEILNGIKGIELKEISGANSSTLKNSVNTNLVNYKIYGNSVQESILPDEYQQVEYIRNNTRKESINTGISPNTNTQVEIDMQIEQYTDNAAKLDFVLGCRTSDSNLYGRFEFHVNSNLSNTLNLGYDTTQAGRTVLTEAVQDFKRHTYVFDSNEGASYMDDVLTCYYTNTSAYKENWKESSLPLHLFMSSYSTVSNHTTYIKIYRCKITKDDILVRDFIPCYRKSDNVIGMYDLVENKFYTNAGTGTFLKGNNAPSPDVPIEIESVGDYDETTGKYKIPVKVSGKNLVDINKSLVGYTLSSEGNITANSNYNVSEYIEIKPNTTYTLQKYNNYNSSGAATNSRCFGYDENKTQTALLGEIPLYDIGIGTKTFTTGPNDKYIRVSIRHTDTEFQLEEGTIATNYEPYYEPITTNIYLNEPLRKIGNAVDYIDFRNQKVVRSIKTYQITGDEDWKLAQTGNLYTRYYAFFTYNVTRDRTFNNCMSNMLVGDTFDNLSKNSKECIAVWYREGQTRVDIALSNDRLTTANELKKWLKTNLVEVYYSLVTPKEENIEIPSILVNQGTNNIHVNTSVAPSKTEIMYYSK